VAEHPRQIEFSLSGKISTSPIICLGLTFPDDAARRAYFIDRLREHLQDPAFRQIEGFPIGADEDILALSDPPWYTACPNPFLSQIIAQWQQERAEARGQLGLPADGENGAYQREPFAADVSEGKNDPIYNAHSYHTKVPHKAIMRYILHYTDPGDIVFDGFCGTGMTGVAAQLCGDRKVVQELGYRVENDGMIYDGNAAISRLGARKAVLNDLSPAATFIAYNYNTPVDTAVFEAEARRILAEVEAELGWMYETWHPHCDHPKRVKARVNYTVWSEMFACPSCGGEIIYYDAAVEKETFEVKDEFECPHCHATLGKKALERLWNTYFDSSLGRTHQLVKYQPVLINYQLGTRRLEKSPDVDDLTLLDKVGEAQHQRWFPMHEMPEGERKGKDGYDLKGISHLHHFYFPRALSVYSAMWTMVDGLRSGASVLPFTRFYLQGSCLGFTKMNRYSANHFSQVNRYFSGTLFVASLISEVSPAYSMTNKLGRLTKLAMPGETGQAALSCQSTTSVGQIADNTFDYIFVDPPFGNNLHYSELNFFWEAWLRVLTNRSPEAVMDKGRTRTLADYQELMAAAFRELYRVLKPERWMTVEFHNSQNRVWNAIQEAMLRAGFVVADVRTLDKQQETYKQSIQKLVKADLVISAYRPAASFERSFQREAGTAEGAWQFVRQHLARLPVVVQQEDVLETLGERQDYLLFDRMVAFHIQRGATVPLSAVEFYAGLRSRFVERDGMFFLPDQVPEYDRARLQAGQVAQLTLFVNDEKSSVQWLRQQLDAAVGGRPQTYQELQPQFLRQLHQARHEALPELSVLLEQNFLQDGQGRWYVPDPNRAGDLEALRLKGLLREFRGYVEGKKKLKQFRSEAVRAGFAQAWKERDFATIVAVAGRLPEQVLLEDAELLMYYDNASLRTH
jgi:predicted RNA-binding Zn-ribbon protein involved in translation (DUF1610 family)